MNIIITGASSGIGEAVLEKLQKDNNILILSRNTGNLKLPNIKWINVDLSKKDEISNLTEIIKEFKCDVLINNAGAGKVSDLESLDISEMVDETLLNLITPMKLTSIVSENMKTNNFGRIINISSISGLKGTPYLFTYSATKAGLINFTQSSSEYFKGYNITVNTICPGGVDTVMAVNGRQEISKLLDMKPKQYQKNMLKNMGRTELITTDEVAELVNFLINMPSINGQCINICGLIEK